MEENKQNTLGKITFFLLFIISITVLVIITFIIPGKDNNTIQSDATKQTDDIVNITIENTNTGNGITETAKELNELQLKEQKRIEA